jgi:hypothetical protein
MRVICGERVASGGGEEGPALVPSMATKNDPDSKDFNFSIFLKDSDKKNI